MPRFLSVKPDTRLITLPWSTPLAEWPTDILVALPRGISRHVVRFVKVGREVYAVKEVIEHLARHEFSLLRDLERLDTPSVDAVGVVVGRADLDGAPLGPVLVTHHSRAVGEPHRLQVPQQHPGGVAPGVQRVSDDVADPDEHAVVALLQDLLRHGPQYSTRPRGPPSDRRAARQRTRVGHSTILNDDCSASAR